MVLALFREDFDHIPGGSMRARRFIAGIAVAVAALSVAVPVQAQGKGKHYAVSSGKAMDVTRGVLERQGYEVVRVVQSPGAQVIYYRRGNKGRGKGHGPMERMVIRTVERRVVFEDVPAAILVDIDVRLKL
jgi:hypothetical protein